MYENEDSGFLGFKIMTLLAFLAGMVFRLNRCHIDHNELISDRKQRLVRYAKLYLSYDAASLLACFISFFTFHDMAYRVLIFPIFCKVYLISNTIEEQKEFLPFSTNIGYIWELSILFLRTVITCHIVGTLYHTLAVIEENLWDETDNWMRVGNPEDPLYDKEWYIRYSESFYWSLATIMLVGSKGETFLETIFCCFTLLATVGMFATILSKIAMILEERE